MIGGKPVLGLIGGIGAGKSHVARAFEAHGGRVVAGDPIGHAALEQPDIRARIAEAWRNRDVVAPDGRIDRKKLAAVVFASPVERTKLEHLVYPWIGRAVRAECDAAGADPAVRFIVLDAAVMLEAGWHRECDRIVYVHAPRPLRLARVAAQRGWTEYDVILRETVQISLTDKALAPTGPWTTPAFATYRPRSPGC